MVFVWAVSGPLFGFSDSWQLVINTTTTVITFWMVFVIQNSQNRDARAIHLKLDEIIRASRRARNEFIIAEKETEAQVEAHESELQELGDRVSRHHGPGDGSGERLDDEPADAEPSQGAAEDAAPHPEPESAPARDRQPR
jgi:low affinity Fe/Cu permease